MPGPPGCRRPGGLLVTYLKTTQNPEMDARYWGQQDCLKNLQSILKEIDLEVKELRARKVPLKSSD